LIDLAQCASHDFAALAVVPEKLWRRAEDGAMIMLAKPTHARSLTCQFHPGMDDGETCIALVVAR
jgi:hypothetical protein